MLVAAVEVTRLAITGAPVGEAWRQPTLEEQRPAAKETQAGPVAAPIRKQAVVVVAQVQPELLRLAGQPVALVALA